MTGQAAPSCNMSANDDFEGDIITQTVLIPETAKHTYYCVLHWNAGSEGGGYCGLQDHPDGKVCIFSLWNSNSTSKPIQSAHDERSATIVCPFGGEGVGMKAMNFNYAWKTNASYTFIVRRWDATYRDINSDGGSVPSTMFALWIHDVAENNWTHVASYNYPVANIYFRPGTGAFLEDWIESGCNSRSMVLIAGAKRHKETQDWSLFTKMRFSANQEQRSADFTNCFNASCKHTDRPFAQFYMASGGSTCRQVPCNTQLEYELEDAITPTSAFPLECSITDCTARKIAWIMARTSAPLFSAIVRINGRVVAQKGCHVRSHKDMYDRRESFDVIGTPDAQVSCDGDSEGPIEVEFGAFDVQELGADASISNPVEASIGDTVEVKLEDIFGSTWEASVCI